jgi:CheY-like chemotaxis protein
MLNRVMVIDDSDADLLYTRIILERCGAVAEVLTFGSAIDALAHLKTPGVPPIDVILLDINMPEMGGFEFLTAYEAGAASERASAVVVMLTSSPDPTDRARAFAFSAVRSYVVKPLDLASARDLSNVAGSLAGD